MALQAVMQNPAIETKDSGVSHMALWKVYLTNLAQAQLDLSAQSAAVQRAVAAYMTLGSFGHVGQVLVDVETHFAVTLDRFLYPNAGDRWFAANKDMDRDGVTNKQEWDYAVAQTAEAKSGSLGAAAAAYAAAAPTHGEGEGGEDPLPPTGTPEDFETACPVPWANVAVLNSSGQTVTARVTTPDGSEELVIGEGQDMDFPLGVEVRVKTDEPSWFSHWTAPDSLLDGSDQPSDSFILTENTEIRAGLQGTWVVEHPDNSYQRVTLNPAGGDEPLVLARGQGKITDRYIKVREGTLLLAEVFQSGPTMPWLKLELTRRDALYAGRMARIYPADVRVALPIARSAPHGIATVMASGANTLPTVNWNSGTKVDPFVRENKYAIPQGPGVTWERSMGATFYPEACYYLYGTSKPKATNLNPNPMAEASASAMSVLTVKPGECEGDCGLDHHGFVRLEHAQRYYVGPTSTRSNAELVGVSAIAAPGHELKGLKIEGGGQVWRWDGQGQVDDYTSLDDMLPAEPDADGLYTGYDLYVEMNTDATVTPVVDTLPPVEVEFDAWVVWHLMNTMPFSPEPYPDYYSGDGRLKDEAGTSRVKIEFEFDPIEGIRGQTINIAESEAYDGSSIDLSGVYDCNVPEYYYEVTEGEGPYDTEPPPLEENTVEVTAEKVSCTWTVHFNIHIGPGVVWEHAEYTVAELDAQITLHFFTGSDSLRYTLHGEHDGFPWYQIKLNDEEVYYYDACANDASPFNLFAPMDVGIYAATPRQVPNQ
jgi:hypothetical protein